MFNIVNFLKEVCSKGASDIHLMVGKVPTLRILNNIVKVKLPALTEEDFDSILSTILYKDQLERIKEKYDFDFTYEIDELARFRVNYCRDLGKPKVTLRVVPYEIPTLAQMGIPESLRKFTEYNNGIILMTGPTGSGKSTTIACLTDLINQQKTKHIITIEDPIEFIYTDKKSLVTQRQIGIDADSFPNGVKYALRQDPDIIVVGEIRDRETMETALTASETGHLVFSTIHTNSAIQTIIRIINMFDEHARDFARDRIANSLRGTIAQKLIHKKDGNGRMPAFEVLTVTPAIKDYILKNDLDKIYPLMKEGGFDNMTTMNNSIYSLLQANMIDQKSALEASDDPIELQQLIKGYYQGVKHKNNDISFE